MDTHPSTEAAREQLVLQLASSEARLATHVEEIEALRVELTQQSESFVLGFRLVVCD
jgi:hypothetical protein